MIAKRIAALVLSILMIITISACSSENTGIEQGEEAFKSETTGSVDTDAGSDIEENKAVNAENNTNTGSDTENNSNTGSNPENNTNTGSDAENNANTETEGDTNKVEAADTDEEPGNGGITKDSESVDQKTGLTSGKTAEESEESVELEESEDSVELEDAAEASEASETAETAVTKTSKNETENSLKPEGGTENEDESRVLEGRIICIDPGHQTRGNYDTEPVAPGSKEMKAKVSSGTAGVKTRIPEYKLNMEVSLKLRDALEKYGATVIMTRIENNVDISNAERAAMANDANADLYLRIHADGSTDKSVNGVSVLIPGKGHISDEYILKESEKAGSSILESFVEATGAKRRGLPKRNDLSGFNWCKVPMALVEMGFMSNAEEDVKLNTEEYQAKMVEGMVKGILVYFDAN